MYAEGWSYYKQNKWIQGNHVQCSIILFSSYKKPNFWFSAHDAILWRILNNKWMWEEICKKNKFFILLYVPPWFPGEY